MGIPDGTQLEIIRCLWPLDTEIYAAWLRARHPDNESTNERIVVRHFTTMHGGKVGWRDGKLTVLIDRQNPVLNPMLALEELVPFVPTGSIAILYDGRFKSKPRVVTTEQGIRFKSILEQKEPSSPEARFKKRWQRKLRRLYQEMKEQRRQK